jgi:RimJ/RimL family protein N-acetyltransferase
MIDHVVEAYNVAELRATVDSGNRRSIALLQRLGFQRVRIRKDAELIRGELRDEEEYRKWIEPHP